MKNSEVLAKLRSDTELDVSIERWTRTTTDQTLTRAKDINRDKCEFTHKLSFAVT